MKINIITNIEAFKALKEDYHLIALTNGNQETAEAQLKYAKIDEYFNGIYSVDVVGKFKPHPSTYQKVLKDYKLKAQEAIMVAAHGWDIAGAQNAGLKTVFVARKGKSLYPLVNTADGLVKDLNHFLIPLAAETPCTIAVNPVSPMFLGSNHSVYLTRSGPDILMLFPSFTRPCIFAA